MKVPPVVALVGALGHGKTCLLNKLTGSRFPSNMGPKSCTQTLQYGSTVKHGILIVDTPGFYASDDIAAHVAAQKLALEYTPLSGVIVVVKFARSDEIAQLLSNLMNFVGDDVRIIVTWDDVARLQDGYNPSETKLTLSKLLEIPSQNITIVGKDTPASSIEEFIFSNLHEPRRFQVGDEQVAVISSLCTASRSFNKAIDEVHAKIAAASKECMDLVKTGRTYETDTAITVLQKETNDMVTASKEKIFRDATDQLYDIEAKNIVYGKAGLALSLRLKSFMDTTNSFLTWNVTDPFDHRNIYKKCNYCGAIYNKTEGCDGRTTCGALPASERQRPKPRLSAEFKLQANKWTVAFYLDGVEQSARGLVDELSRFFSRHIRQPFSDYRGSTASARMSGFGSHFGAGCGQVISWSTMLPVDPELVKTLGNVEMQQEGRFEELFKADFQDQISVHTAKNVEILKSAFK